MADQTLLTVFVAVTAVAVLIQTGILVGFYFLSAKLSRQADRGIDMARNFFGPLQATAENLRKATVRIAEFSSTAQEQLRQLERWWTRRAA
jgi:hypothetical protein